MKSNWGLTLWQCACGAASRAPGRAALAAAGQVEARAQLVQPEQGQGAAVAQRQQLPHRPRRWCPLDAPAGAHSVLLRGHRRVRPGHGRRVGNAVCATVQPSIRGTLARMPGHSQSGGIHGDGGGGDLDL